MGKRLVGKPLDDDGAIEFNIIPDSLNLTIDEVHVLYKYLEHEHIPYENLELLEVVRKISRFADTHDKQ